jgi:hypothetical protein
MLLAITPFHVFQGYPEHAKPKLALSTNLGHNFSQLRDKASSGVPELIREQGLNAYGQASPYSFFTFSQ